jgi:hypothetical protein
LLRQAFSKLRCHKYTPERYYLWCHSLKNSLWLLLQHSCLYISKHLTGICFNNYAFVTKTGLFTSIYRRIERQFSVRTVAMMSDKYWSFVETFVEHTAEVSIIVAAVCSIWKNKKRMNKKIVNKNNRFIENVKKNIILSCVFSVMWTYKDRFFFSQNDHY